MAMDEQYLKKLVADAELLQYADVLV